MFGLKMNPQRLLAMLPGFGIDINTLLPQLESLLVEQALKLEKEAGAKLVGVINLNPVNTHLEFGLYRQNPANPGSLEIWKSFPFSELINKIKNVQTEDATESDNRPTATIEPATTATDPGTDPGIDPGSNPGSDPEPDGKPGE